MSNLHRSFKVESENIEYGEDYIQSKYEYRGNPEVQLVDGVLKIKPNVTNYEFKTDTRVPKTGLMIVGWGGNNGTTVTGSIIANKLGINWHQKSKVVEPNYFGSITQASTIRVGTTSDGKDQYIPFNEILPMVHPNDFVITGWDINSANLAEGMIRADVFPYELQTKLAKHLEGMVPLPSIYCQDFIAANQESRADNVIDGDKQFCLEQIRTDIREFKENNQLDKIVIVWSANTERFSDVIEGKNDTAENLLESIKQNEEEVSPSTIFAVASILENTTFINGSPQNTFVPGVIELAAQNKVFIGGDDFKSGQTKMKSVLVDFLVSAGIKPLAITSYNHLGNNDGKNLSAPKQFRSKEISKSNVVDDMVESNGLLYAPGEHPDHTVVIKYVPTVGDSKRAMDEYVSEIFMGGLSTIAIHNTCEDSLLAAPLIIDLAVVAELFTRIEYKSEDMEGFQGFHSILSVLSYLLKAPLVPEGTPVVNALFRQKACLENILKACVGLNPEDHMLLQYKQI